MTLAYLLDTNVLAEPLRLRPDAKVMRRLQRYEGTTAIPAPVWHEMWFGCMRLADGKRRTAIEHYLLDVLRPTLPLLPYTAGAAQWHARERARLTAKGRPPQFVDGQIASIAAEQDLTLVTHNVADFKIFDGLQVVDWSR